MPLVNPEERKGPIKCPGKGPLCGLFWAFKGSENLNLRKLCFFVWFSLLFSNEIETSGGQISSTRAIWEVSLRFLDAPGFPLQNNIKIGKVTKIAGICGFFLVGPPMYFPLKTETRGHNSSTSWSWKPPSGFLDAPCFKVDFLMPLKSLSIKAFSLKK